MKRGHLSCTNEIEIQAKKGLFFVVDREIDREAGSGESEILLNVFFLSSLYRRRHWLVSSLLANFFLLEKKIIKKEKKRGKL